MTIDKTINVNPRLRGENFLTPLFMPLIPDREINNIWAQIMYSLPDLYTNTAYTLILTPLYINFCEYCNTLFVAYPPLYFELKNYKLKLLQYLLKGFRKCQRQDRHAFLDRLWSFCENAFKHNNRAEDENLLGPGVS
jgi:hypothetical protein